MLSESTVSCPLRVRSVSFTSRAKGCINFVPHSCLVSLSHKVGFVLEETICYFIYAKFAGMLRLSINWKSTKQKMCFNFLVQYTRKCINFTHLRHKPIKLCVIYSKWICFIRNQSQRSRDHIKEKVASTTKSEQNNGISMINTSNEGTGGLVISYSSRKMRGKVLNFI